jgi:hypothetical protein
VKSLKEKDDKIEFVFDLDNSSIRNLLKDTVNLEEIKWDAIQIVLKLTQDSKTKLPLFSTCESILPLREGGDVRFQIKVEIKSYDEQNELQFIIKEGDKTRIVDVTEEAKKELGIR